MSLNQYKTFEWPVHKSNGGGTAGLAAIVEVGDTVYVVQRDRQLGTIVLTDVQQAGKRLGWAITAGQLRSDDINAVDGRHQYIAPADANALHDDESQFGDLPVVQR